MIYTLVILTTGPRAGAMRPPMIGNGVEGRIIFENYSPNNFNSEGIMDSITRSPRRRWSLVLASVVFCLPAICHAAKGMSKSALSCTSATPDCTEWVALGGGAVLPVIFPNWSLRTDKVLWIKSSRTA